MSEVIIVFLWLYMFVHFYMISDGMFEELGSKFLPKRLLVNVCLIFK